MVPQRRPLVLLVEQSAALQHRDRVAREVLEVGGRVGRHHREAVSRARTEPRLQVVGDLLRRPDDQAVATAEDEAAAGPMYR